MFSSYIIIQETKPQEERNTEMAEEEAAMVEGQAQIWKIILAFADSMAIRCVVELGIPDIINTHGGPASLPEIAAGLNSPSPDVEYLNRVMRLCVRKGLFTTTATNGGGETLYGLTPASKWLLRGYELSLAPMVHVATHEWVVSPWRYFSQCVNEGGDAFTMAYGSNMFEYASVQPEFNKLFNSAMASTSKIAMEAMLESYKNGFEDVSSVVDIGGGTGTLIREIVKAHPHVQGINFDLPHVVATAPEATGVENVSGDMFVDVPPADAYVLKSILHDWNDENCIKILKNCRNAMGKRRGKIIIVDLVLKPQESGLFDELRVIFDLVMMALTSGGKERTEAEWKNILEKGEFSHYKVIECNALPSIIEAYPNELN